MQHVPHKDIDIKHLSGLYEKSGSAFAGVEATNSSEETGTH